MDTIPDHDPSETLDRLARLAVLLTGADAAVIRLRSAEGELCAVAGGLEGASRRDLLSLCDLAIHSPVPIVATEIHPELAHMGRLGIGALVAIPLSAQSGALCVAAKRSREWSPEHMAGLDDIARLAAMETAGRLALQIAVSRILAGTPNPEAALTQVLEAIGGGLGLHVGVYWGVDEAEQCLRPRIHWVSADMNAEAFLEKTNALSFGPGHGLPGRVWASRKPEQVEDTAHAPHFPRGLAAAESGLAFGFAFPVMAGAKVMGVMELFGRNPCRLDEAFLDNVGTLGHQLGQYLRRKRAERSLRDSETLKAAILSSALDCIVTISADSKVVEWNAAAERTFGYSRAEAVGRDLAQLIIPPNYRQVHYDGMARYLATGEGAVLGKRVELEAQRRDGTRFPVELAITATQVAGKPLFTAYLRDIMLRKRGEQALRESEERFRFIVEATSAVVWTTDAHGEFHPPQPMWSRFTGQDDGELAGRGWLEAIHSDDRALTLKEWGEAVRQGTFFGIEHRLRQSGGTFRHMMVRAVPVRNADGSIREWVGLHIDITERKRWEQELAAARDLAEEANRAKSQFIANMSHELRTPLTAVIGYSEMVAEELEDEGADALVPDVKKIETNARHLLDLINGVLDISKIEAGRMEVHAETFDAGELAREVANTCQTLVERKGNRLVLDIPSGLGLMTTDVVKLRQCLINLLSNAAKFTEYGTVTLSARRSRAEDGDWIRFAVRDTGIGMSEAQAARLFERFVQADSSTTRRFGGSGLGLAITKAFTTMLGGEVAVETREGEGSTFVLHLPTELGRQREPAPMGEYCPTGADKVLVVDDEPAMRDVLAHFLRREGFGAVLAADAETGLELARKLQPRAILLDVMMPRVDGWSVLSALKAAPDLADIPVIMVSVAREKGLALSLGATDYFTKPVDWQRLRGVLRRCCGPCPVSALLVEGEDDTWPLLRQTLEQDGWRVQVAADADRALELLGREAPGVILLDLLQPRLNGFAFLQELRRHPEWRAIPVIAVTAQQMTEAERERLDGQVRQVISLETASGDELLRELKQAVAEIREDDHGQASAG